MKEKRRKYLLILKLMLLLTGSYLLIQLSNEAKHMEEKAGIPGLETTYDFAGKYLDGQYGDDWRKRGHRFYEKDSYLKFNELFLQTDNGEIEIWVAGRFQYDKMDDYEVEMFGFTFWAGEDRLTLEKYIEKRNSLFSIRIAYNGDPHIQTYYYASDDRKDYILYNIEYDNNRNTYLLNAEMEQQTGITTEEVVDWAEDMRRIFEEEMQKMHDYQIEKAAGKRKVMTNIAYVFLIIAVVWKLCLAAGRFRKEQIPFGECFREAVGQTINAFWKRRYLLLGMWTAFWIYILQPLLSRFDYWGLSETMKEYAAYGTGAVLVAAGNLLAVSELNKLLGRHQEQSVKIPKAKAALQVIAGCVTMILLIRLGIMMASDYYPNEWSFYGTNIVVDAVSFFLFGIMVKVKGKKV